MTSLDSPQTIKLTNKRTRRLFVRDPYDHKTSLVSEHLVADTDEKRFKISANKYQSQPHFQHAASNILNTDVGRFADEKNLKAIRNKEAKTTPQKKQNATEYNKRIDKLVFLNTKQTNARFHCPALDGRTSKKRINWAQNGSVAQCFVGHGYE